MATWDEADAQSLMWGLAAQLRGWRAPPDFRAALGQVCIRAGAGVQVSSPQSSSSHRPRDAQGWSLGHHPQPHMEEGARMGRPVCSAEHAGLCPASRILLASLQGQGKAQVPPLSPKLGICSELRTGPGMENKNPGLVVSGLQRSRGTLMGLRSC